MIKFFRKIRQQLLTENKFSKYLLYAIGEIMLVVIGILIALQINNWKEEQKEKKLSKDIIQNLYTDFIRNKSSIHRTINLLEGTKKASRNVAYFIDNGFLTSIEDSLKLQYNHKGFLEKNYGVAAYDIISLVHNLDRAGFIINYDLILPTWEEVVNSNRIGLITNKEIKDKIVRLFLTAGEVEDLETRIRIPVMQKYQTKRATFYDVSKSTAATYNGIGLSEEDAPINIETLQSDQSFRKQLQLVYRSANEQQSTIHGLIELPADSIIALLKIELDKFEL